MIDFHIHKVGYRGRLVADIDTGLIGRICDKNYSGLYEVWFEREPYQQEHAIEVSDQYPLETQSEFPNRSFKKANQLILID